MKKLIKSMPKAPAQSKLKMITELDGEKEIQKIDNS
jgi:hypothetical protein